MVRWNEWVFWTESGMGSWANRLEQVAPSKETMIKRGVIVRMDCIGSLTLVIMQFPPRLAMTAMLDLIAVIAQLQVT